MRLLMLLILVVPEMLRAQGNYGQYMNFVFEANLPEKIYHFYDQKEIRTVYAIRTDLNPFYIRGDFDGDNKQDYALSIVDRKTNRKGILVYHTGTKKHYVIGAGKPLSNGNGGDDYTWMDAWKVYTDKKVGMGVGETTNITLRGEGIHVFKLEAASGIIYWTGREYRWYQQGD